MKGFFRLGSSKPQRIEEWLNVTRTSPSDPFFDDGNPSDLSLVALPSNGLPSSSSLSSRTPDVAALLHTSEATPEMDRWRSSIPARAKDDNQVRHRPEFVIPSGGGATVSIYVWTGGIRDAFGFVVVACVACPGFFPAAESKNSQVAPITAFSRILLYPWAAFDVVTQTSLTGRTTTTPYLSAHFPTGPTLAYKPGLCPFTSYSCITNFEYTLTFASRSSDPIISKTADSSITHHAESFQSRVA
ncbi:hypothetical protein EDB84DRAFT_1566779 [Lactarius hengduanensis]|nr:hypothetical protein EDB84DRAFT_1566779 [Lactarius hengduanensis]